MKVKLKTKHLILLSSLLIIGCVGYYYRDRLKEILTRPPERAVNKALIYLKSENKEILPMAELFSPDYVLSIMSNYSIYRIEEWDLNSEYINDKEYKVEVKGTTTNVYGTKLERNPFFIVEKVGSNWWIKDSYNFAVIEGIDDGTKKSDIEKHKSILDVKEKVKVENWSFSSSYGDNVKGIGTIVNNSGLPVRFVKFLITYKNKSGDIVNTDETYAIGGDYLLPGQRRKFDWITTNCYDCDIATSSLNFSY